MSALRLTLLLPLVTTFAEPGPDTLSPPPDTDISPLAVMSSQALISKDQLGSVIDPPSVTSQLSALRLTLLLALLTTFVDAGPDTLSSPPDTDISPLAVMSSQALISRVQLGKVISPSSITLQPSPLRLTLLLALVTTFVDAGPDTLSSPPDTDISPLVTISSQALISMLYSGSVISPSNFIVQFSSVNVTLLLALVTTFATSGSDAVICPPDTDISPSVL